MSGNTYCHSFSAEKADHMPTSQLSVFPVFFFLIIIVVVVYFTLVCF